MQVLHLDNLPDFAQRELLDFYLLPFFGGKVRYPTTTGYPSETVPGSPFGETV